MSEIQRLEIAVDAAELVRREAWDAYRKAHQDFFAADYALFTAQLNLADALEPRAAIAPPSDTRKKARK